MGRPRGAWDRAESWYFWRLYGAAAAFDQWRGHEPAPSEQRLIDKAYACLELDEAAARPPILVLSTDQSEELFFADGAAEGATLLALLTELPAEDSPGLQASYRR